MIETDLASVEFPQKKEWSRRRTVGNQNRNENNNWNSWRQEKWDSVWESCIHNKVALRCVKISCINSPIGLMITCKLRPHISELLKRFPTESVLIQHYLRLLEIFLIPVELLLDVHLWSSLSCFLIWCGWQVSMTRRCLCFMILWISLGLFGSNGL